jgi:hypothetical protein
MQARFVPLCACLVLPVLLACSRKPDSGTEPQVQSASVAAAGTQARPASAPSALPEGNAASGATPKAALLALSTSGAACAACSFNARCALLTNGDTKLPCCDYTGGREAGAWGEDTSGHAAECLASILDAPVAPAKAKGKLQPLAKSGQACHACWFNGRCALLAGGASPDGPCCDYTGGKTPAAWPDQAQGAECLANEAGVARARTPSRGRAAGGTCLDRVVWQDSSDLPDSRPITLTGTVRKGKKGWILELEGACDPNGAAIKELGITNPPPNMSAIAGQAIDARFVVHTGRSEEEISAWVGAFQSTVTDARTLLAGDP